MGKFAALSLLLVLSAGTTTSSASTLPCAMSGSDRAWLSAALDNWSVAERAWLELDPQPLPDVVVIDSHCVYEMAESRFDSISGQPHDTKAVEVGDKKLPIGPLSFADGSGRFVMSLPSVWRAAGVTSKAGLERLMNAVLLHEIMHTRQARMASNALDEAERFYGDEVGDDHVQKFFENNAEYVAVYERERDLLYAAAAAQTDVEARQLATQALALMRERRSRWFTGEHRRLVQLEDVFLTMEGMGQWLIYRYFSGQDDLSTEVVLSETRRGGHWTQDQGLALFLTLDRLLPDWRKRAFREPDWRAERLLSAAVTE